MITEGYPSRQTERSPQELTSINDILDRLTYHRDIQVALLSGGWLDRRAARGYLQPLFEYLPPDVTHLDLGDDVVVGRGGNRSVDFELVWDLERVDSHLAQE